MTGRAVDLAEPEASSQDEARDPVPVVLRELRSGVDGLTQREAQRRLIAQGPNTLPVAVASSWWREVAAQLGHPLALLLWAAAGLAAVAGTPVLSGGIVVVIGLNAVFAVVQERQAQRAVHALSAYLPSTATVMRDGELRRVSAADLVPGDVLLVEEGDRVPADARLLQGALQLDMSALSGESAPVERAAGRQDPAATLLALPDLIFNGTLCTAGAGRAVVLRTGIHSEIGRIASLTQRVQADRSPLEQQVRRVAWLIAAVGIGIGAAFLPLGVLAGLPLHAAVLFAIGLLVANVPEGLLPTITLALASGVRELARKGAVVKRLAAVETLGSTTVICTDKTGTLTQNRMRAVAIWTADVGVGLIAAGTDGPASSAAAVDLATGLAGCSVVEPVGGVVSAADPTDLALDLLAAQLGAPVDAVSRDARRRANFRFDPDRRLSSAIQERADGLWLCVKGAPESVLDRCVAVRAAQGDLPLDAARRQQVHAGLDTLTGRGLRVIAVACRALDAVTADRDDAERQLTLLGLAALEDPPRPEVAAAVRDCHRAGIRILIVTGDNGRTAAEVARQVGIGAAGMRVIDGAELDRMPENQLDALLDGREELVFARSSPEAKLRIADALRALGNVVAMTGDGVNDAPALHRADIGIAMGLGGTEVAREAATMVLADDNFATIVRAVGAGRQVYDNVRKFILYIFAHAIPEIVPFLAFALSGGAIPMPLTVMQILAIDLGTETLPALALGREPAEPGIMSRRPRGRRERVITRELLVRAWVFLGLISAVLVMGAYFFVLWRAGWRPGYPVGTGTRLHEAYRQATTAAWAGLVTCQVGTAFAARTDHASLRQIGVLSNRLLLWGVAFELVFAAALVWTPGIQEVFGTAPLPLPVLGLIATFPVIVWGADEMRRASRRRRQVGR